MPENSINDTELDEPMYFEENHETFDEQISLKSQIDKDVELDTEQKIEQILNDVVVEITEPQIFSPRNQINSELNMLTENLVGPSLLQEESSYQCRTCNRIFKKRYRLKNHQKTHTGINSNMKYLIIRFGTLDTCTVTN